MNKREDHSMSSSSEDDNSEPESPKITKRIKMSNESPKRVLTEVKKPYLGFYLTKVEGIPSKFNHENIAMDIKDILSDKHGKLLQSAQFSYVIDVEWLVKQYPQVFRSLPILIVHGEQRQSKRALEKSGSSFSNITFCQAKLPITFGTHHTKMMLLLYKEGLRIVIHTSNLVEYDWCKKTQAMWRSPLFPPLKDPKQQEPSKTNFKADLIQYLEAYGCADLNNWITIIKKHDMSSASVFLIGSVPGRHRDAQKVLFGHLKLKKLLSKHIQKPSKPCPIIAQFSSIGSLGASESVWLCREFLLSIASSVTSGITPASMLHLIYPSVENVRLSLEGYPAGVSLPYSYKVEQKQPYMRKFFCQWQADKTGRTEASPHIKTYIRINPDYKSISWFLLTSANLSRAAWGCLEKNGEQLMIRSFELGVLFIPEMFNFENFSIEEDTPSYFPIPYDLPPKKYLSTDEPWTWDAPHIKAPDRHGNKWCPS